MNEEFYIINKPVSVKESFNNTILLLTMIKSEYYYIISFSREKGQIEIGFDYESELHGKITETVVADFYCNESSVILSCSLKNIALSDFVSVKSIDNRFTVADSNVIYKSEIPRDGVVPISIKALNEYIMKTRSEIISFLEDYYHRYISIS